MIATEPSKNRSVHIAPMAPLRGSRLIIIASASVVLFLTLFTMLSKLSVATCLFGFDYLSMASPVMSGAPVLRFTSNGTFQIAVFEDLHYGEGELLVIHSDLQRSSKGLCLFGISVL